MKKTIRLKFVGYWDGFVPENTRIYKDLASLYDIELTDEPDYIICSCFAPYYEYCKYPQIRIMDLGENYTPDFNLIDYAVCRYPIQFLDRCYYYPGCIDFRGRFESLLNNERHIKKDDLKDKCYFANFIAGHDSEDNIRGDFFKMLSEYKRIESPGTYLNNMPNQCFVDWKDSSKTDFQKKCKFSLCFESTKNAGFFTEKIVDALYSGTVPVYFGSEEVFEIINRDAVVYCSGRDDFENTVNKVIELDQNDQLYLEILNKNPLNTNFSYEQFKQGYNDFLIHIFEQPLESAYRRSQVYLPKQHEEFLLSKIGNKNERKQLWKIWKR